MRIYIPTKILCRDGYCPVIKSANDVSRFCSQPFGVNWAPDDVYKQMGMLGHDGIDFAIPVGTPIYATHDGVVFDVDNNDDRDGLGIELYDPVQKLRTIYWHHSKNLVKLGDKITVGQLIGESGGTGKAYGPHLHFGLYQTDDNGQIINKDNGFKGAIDPMPYLILLGMTLEEIKMLQALEGYNDPEGAKYWVGKPLSAYLDTRLDDKIKTIQEAQNANN